MKVLISKILGVFWITLALVHLQQEKPWKEINHSHYSFSYPAEWDLRFQNNSNEGFTLKLPGKYAPQVVLAVYRIPDGIAQRDLPNYFGDLESTPGYKGGASNLDTTASDTNSTISVPARDNLWTRIKIDTTSHNGQSYLEALHQREDANESYMRIWRVYDKDNFRYNLIFQCKEHDWQVYESDILKTFNSFKLK